MTRCRQARRSWFAEETCVPSCCGSSSGGCREFDVNAPKVDAKSMPDRLVPRRRRFTSASRLSAGVERARQRCGTTVPTTYAEELREWWLRCVSS